MAPPPLLSLLPLSLLAALLLHAAASNSVAQAQTDQIGLRFTTEALEWPSAMSVHDFDEDLDVDDEIDRRSLYWTARRRYTFISYGALSANRIPCPARSGRSYYTNNCYLASGPVHPYSRGCSAITQCRT